MEAVTHYVKDLRNLLDSSPLMERKSFIRSFIKEARVTGSEVALIYTIPMSLRGITDDGPAVLPIVQHGGGHWTVPELVFEKKHLIPALQQLLVSF